MKMNLLHSLKNLFFQEQSKCFLCNRAYPDNLSFYQSINGLCPSCTERIEYIIEPICLVCGRKMDQSGKCHDCKRRAETFFLYNRSAVIYNSLMKEWIYTYKYRGREQLAIGLVELLHRAYQQYFQELRIGAVTFVPLHAERLYERKFNQAEQLAYRLSKRIGVPAIPTLARIRETPKQSHQSRVERLISLVDSFQYIGAAPSQHSILIIDDIYTTGSTLNECAKVLKKNGWEKVYTCTIARA